MCVCVCVRKRKRNARKPARVCMCVCAPWHLCCPLPPCQRVCAHIPLSPPPHTHLLTDSSALLCAGSGATMAAIGGLTDDVPAIDTSGHGPVRDTVWIVGAASWADSGGVMRRLAVR